MTPLLRTLYIGLICISISVDIGSEIPLNIDDPTDCSLEVEVPDDFHVCFDEEFNLGGIINGNYEDFIWFEDGDETNHDLDEELSINTTTTFTLLAWAQSDQNIIENGDFEDGNTGFTTDYVVGSFSCFGLGYLDCEGTYDVIDNPTLGHANFASCSDVEGGGNMMVVNGAASLQQIWCQEVCVEEGATYNFSAWAASVNPGSPAQLQFAIDGSLIGSLFSLTSNTCDWEDFEAEWESESTTTIEICVTNQNTAAGGNDFALDNIGFYQICEDEASFTVTHSEFELELEGIDELDCNTQSTDLLLNIYPTNLYDITLWFESDIILEETEENLYTTLDEAGEYELVVTDEFGCELELDFEIEADYNYPDIELDFSNILDCNNPESILSADSNQRGLDFSWLNEENEVLGDHDELSIELSGLYYLIASDPDTGCSSIDSIYVGEDYEVEEFNIHNEASSDCNVLESLLFTTLSSESVQWSFNDSIDLVDNTDSIIVYNSGIYTAIITHDNGCHSSDSIYVEIHEPAFEYQINYDSLINCLNTQASIQLNVDTSIYNVTWMDLNSNYSDSLSFSLMQAGIYNYSISDSLSCEIQDSIIITEDLNTPIVNLHTDSIECLSNEALFFIENPNQEYSIEWNFENSPSYYSDSITVSQTGILYYTVTGVNGCFKSGETEVKSSINFPNVNIEGQNIDCTNGEVVLTADSDQIDVEYLWLWPNLNNIDSTESITTSTPGQYTLQVTNDHNCVSVVDYFVNIDTISPVFELDEDAVIDCNNVFAEGQVNISGDYDTLIYGGTWLDPQSLLYNISEPGSYQLTVQAENGCSTNNILNVTIDTLPPELNINNNYVLDCNHYQLELTIPDSGQYTSAQWQNIDSVFNNSSINVDQGGEYIAIVTASNGCTNSASVIVNEDFDSLAFNVNSSIIDCYNPFSNVEITAPPGYHSHSVFQEGNEISQDLDFQISAADSLIIILTADNGCTSSQVHNIVIDTATVSFDLSSDTLSCKLLQTNIILNSNSAFEDAQIFNASGENIGDIYTTVSEPGFYSVQLKNYNGCISENTIEIQEFTDPPSIESFSEEKLNCEEAILLSDLNISGGHAPYSLYIDNQVFDINDQTFYIADAGSHDILIIDDNSCQTDTTISIPVLIELEAYITPEVTIKFGESQDIKIDINKDLSEIKSVNWFPQQGLSCYDCLNPLITGEDDIDYTITIVDVNGCETEIELRILVEREIRYFIPNVLNNNDSRNNSFTIYSKDNDITSIIKLNIFDRWGNLVFSKEHFEANDPELGWDGTFNNDLVNQGVYVYVAELEFRNGESEIVAGDITLIR